MSVADLGRFDFVRAESVHEACALLAANTPAHHLTFPLAGCTDWMVQQHASTPASGTVRRTAVDISRISELRQISDQGQTLLVGAAATFSDIVNSSLLQTRCSLLAGMARTVGSPQIRSRGTIGGNLVSASPAADGVAALFALEADVLIASTLGRRTVAVRQFFTGYRQHVLTPSELVTGFSFRTPASFATQSWTKIGTRRAQSISKIAVAAISELACDGTISRIGFGVASAGPAVLAMPATSAAIVGRKRDDLDWNKLRNTIDSDIAPIDDIRSTAEYRRHLAEVLVRRFVGRS